MENNLMDCGELGTLMGRVGYDSLISYPLDKYLPHTRTHIRQVSVMQVSA